MEAASNLAEHCAFTAYKDDDGIVHVTISAPNPAEQSEVVLTGPAAVALTMAWCASSLAGYAHVVLADDPLATALRAIAAQLGDLPVLRDAMVDMQIPAAPPTAAN